MIGPGVRLQSVEQKGLQDPVRFRIAESSRR